MTTEVSINRTSLSLTPLVISTETTGPGLVVAEDGFGRPALSWSRNYATARDWDGAIQTDARLEQTALPIALFVVGTSSDDAADRYDELVAAVHQFTFDLTITVDGVSRTWAADCADVTPGDYDAGLVAVFIHPVSLTIPLYPLASA